MNWIGSVAHLIFLIGWAVAAVAGLYSGYHQTMIWFGHGKLMSRVKAHWRPTLKGYAVFFGCLLFLFLDEKIGEWFGGWTATPGWPTTVP
jgi:hypothetical protein